MNESYREAHWRMKGRPRELYPDVSSKDAPVPPDLPVPHCDCGIPAHVCQSRHPDTAARVHYTCGSCHPYLRCFFFQWVDGPEKHDPRYLLFDDWWRGRTTRERFQRWVPPPPNPPPMTDELKEYHTIRRLEDPPRCDCGDPAVVDPQHETDFICPNPNYPYGGRKCYFREWLYGPKSKWPETKKDKSPQRKEYFEKCRCGVPASYGLVPSGLGVGYFCGWMIEYRPETRHCGWETWDDREEVKQIVREQKALGKEYLDNYVKLRKEEMVKLARKKGCQRPELVEMMNRKRAMEAEASEQAAIRAQKKKLHDVISGLCLKIGIGPDHIVEEARAKYVESHLTEAQLRGERPEDTTGQEAEDDDDMSRLNNLLSLAEADLRAQEDDDDMSRLGHLLSLAEADLRAQEEDDAWLSQAADVVEAAYYERKANENQAADTSTNSDLGLSHVGSVESFHGSQTTYKGT